MTMPDNVKPFWIDFAAARDDGGASGENQNSEVSSQIISTTTVIPNYQHSDFYKPDGCPSCHEANSIEKA